MNTKIEITNNADRSSIDIEGTIGMPEQWQFDDPADRVATYDRFREQVAAIAALGCRHIDVNIRSTGGDVNDALLIYEALRATGAEITTCCYGYTASAATIIAQAASEGRRLIAPSSLYLVHNSLCAAEGNALDLEIEADLLHRTDERIASLYAERSGRDAETFRRLMAENGGRGRWLSPQQAVEAGLVDRIAERRGDTPPCNRESIDDARRPQRGVLSLLRALLPGREARPETEDLNITHPPADKPEPLPPLPEASAASAAHRTAAALDQGQRAVEATRVCECEDPSLGEGTRSPNNEAYARDARSLSQRHINP